MSTTYLNLTGTPGRAYSFAPKAALVLPAGFADAAFSMVQPGTVFAVVKPGITFSAMKAGVEFNIKN